MDSSTFAGIWTANYYDRTGYTIDNSDVSDYSPMVVAINVGILRPSGDLTNALSYDCSSGN